MRGHLAFFAALLVAGIVWAAPEPVVQPLPTPSVVIRSAIVVRSAAVLTVRDVTVHVGRRARIPVIVAPGVSVTVQAIDLALWYAPEGIAVDAVDTTTTLPGCAAASRIDPGLVRVSIACTQPQTLTGMVVTFVVRGVVPGRSLLTVRDCDLSRVMRGIESHTDCTGLGGRVVVLP